MDFLFWAMLELFRCIRIPESKAQIVAIFLIAVGFAFAHIGRTGVGFVCTVLTGAAFGAMRAWSQSTAAAALMHGVYNFAICLMTLAPRSSTPSI